MIQQQIMIQQSRMILQHRERTNIHPIAHRHAVFAIVCLVIALFMSVESASGQEADDVQPNQPLFLQAEKLIGNATPNGFVRELIGNVVLTQGAVTITCNRAVHYIEQNRADMFGNVVMKQGTVTMKAAQGTYDGFSRQISGSGGVTLLDRNSTLTAREGTYSAATKIARFYRTVNIENDSLIISCDTLEYHRATQNSYASGKAVAVSKVSSAYLQGDSLVNIPSKRYSRITSYRNNAQPMVSQIDTVDADKSDRPFQQSSQQSSQKKNSSKASAKKQAVTSATVELPEKRLDTLCITGNLLEAFRSDSNEVYLATGNVQMTRRQLAGRADLGVYEKTFNRIRLLPSSTLEATGATATTADTAKALPVGTSSTKERPRLWLDSTQLRSDSLIVLLEEKRLERIDAFGNAFAASKNDTAHQDRIDQLSGENIIITIRRDTMRSVVAEGKAFNLYFGSSDNDDGTKQPDGAVRNAADTIKVLFAKGEIETIVWRGKVEGEYIPEHITRKQLQTLRLKGFAWMNDRPVLERGGSQKSKPAVAKQSNPNQLPTKKQVMKPTEASKLPPTKNANIR
jgi:lipopolysaccharide export system protein LptA